MPGPLQRVLVVEDDQGIRDALAECVASLGIEVRTAEDSRGGLAQLAEGWVPCCILLDLRLPGLDGNGFLERIRAEPRWAGVPVITMSAWEDRPRLAVFRHLEKPFDLDEIAKALTLLCARPSA